MARFSHPLDNIQIASPCRADWEGMIGTDRSRYCGQCKLNVYNLSGMSRHEAEELITRSEGRLCVRFFRRADGTVITQNCPVGLAAAKVRVRRWAVAVLSTVIAFFSGIGLYAGWMVGFTDGQPNRPVGTMGVLKARVPDPEVGQMIQGGMIYERDVDVARIEQERRRVRQKQQRPRLDK